MPTGTVKWFNPTKGYGFIQPQGGGKDVFVHISAVERAGLSGLNEGQAIEFELVSNRGKTSAEMIWDGPAEEGFEIQVRSNSRTRELKRSRLSCANGMTWRSDLGDSHSAPVILIGA